MAEAASRTERLKWWVEVLTPTGLLLGLLYYFGYVTTDAWFRYFGLELSQVGLPQHDIVLQSIAALYLPVGALIVLGAAVYVARRGINAALSRGWHPQFMRVAGALAVAAGALLVVRALLGVFIPDIARHEPIALSPMSLCAGVLLVAAGVDVIRRTSTKQVAAQPQWATLLVAALVVLGLFWATNSVAGAYGAGRALDFARTLHSRPAVVVDTKERLFLVRGTVEETALASEGDATYRYRYRNLRLLAASGDKLYLAPADWRRGAGTIVVLDGGEVRLQFLR
jgi:hypothetical protein